jgi:uncharacterized lipoprotein YmbA
MKRLLFALTASIIGCCLGAQAAISVGPTGSGTLTFNALPSAGDWSTLTNSGASADITDAAGLDTAVQTNVASAINMVLGSTATTAPAISSSGIARWNSAILAVQTVPTGVGYVSLMATLQNDTGGNQTALTFSYDLTENHATGGANPNAVVEEIPGHRVYFSLTGAAGSWQVVPEVATFGTPGTKVGTANVGSWPNGGLMYLLWADDNAAADRNNTNNEEGGYLIDNVTFKAGVFSGVVPVGPAGSGTISFSTYPSIQEGWYTAFNGGANGDIIDTTGLDAAAQTNVGAAFTEQLGSSATVAPSISSSPIARWNSTLGLVETVATGVGYVSLLAKLRNDSGADKSTLNIAYELNELNADGTTVVEEVPGHRVFYSLTGDANSWTLIPEFSSGTLGTLTATLTLGSWPPGSLLYILWVDDNSSSARDNTSGANTEGGYTIDNVVFSFSAISGVTLASPANGQTFPQGVPIALSALAILPGTVTDVSFFDGVNLIGSDNAAPFSSVLSNATLGAHQLTAKGTDDLNNMATSPVVNITVVPNSPPAVTLTNPINGASFFVGTNFQCQARASDADGTVARVEFYLDGALFFTDTTSPYSFEYCDITVGSHTIAAVAVDNGGFRGTNAISISATNPPGITVIIPNGSIWKYLDDGSDQGTFWHVPEALDDSGWSNGVAELGYGDAAGNNRPERTVLSFGPDQNAKFPTTYFRKIFTVADPTAFGMLTLRVLRDDGAIVYINGPEVFRTGIASDTVVDFSTYTPPAVADDGTIFQEASIASSVLVPGNNLVAVEIHQDAGNSTDISFDLMLWGTGPILSITPISATRAQISWAFPSTGFVLESKTVLTAASWNLVTEPDVPDANFHHVTVNTTTGTRFFRLRKP